MGPIHDQSRIASELKHLPMSLVNLKQMPFEVQEHHEEMAASSDGRIDTSIQDGSPKKASVKMLIDDNPYQVKTQDYPELTYKPFMNQNGVYGPNSNIANRTFIKKYHSKKVSLKSNT